MNIAMTDPAVQKLAPPPKKPGRTFKASVMSADEPIYRKVLAIGRSGFGKTRMIADIVRTGAKVFVADTDFGGNGLSTVQETLKEAGCSELLKNVAWFEFGSYKDFTYFTAHPESVEVDGKPLWDWDPDVIAWEGLANFQEKHVTEYALDLAPMRSGDKGNVGEAREAGLWAEQVDWGIIRRATLFAIEDLLRLHNPNGKKIHKLVTVLQDAGREDKLTQETKRGPLLMGAARDYIPAAFDLILTLEATSKPGDKSTKYVYRCDASNNSIVSKRRALPVAAIEPADMYDLWKRITGTAAR